MIYDRYNYVNNRPTVNTDPTGHRPIGDEDMQKTIPCAQKPTGSAVNVMKKYPISTTSYMDTYAIASIGVQNPVTSGWPEQAKQNIAGVWHAWFGGEASQGLAKLKNSEMKEFFPSSSPLPDPNDAQVALAGMTARIEKRLDICNRDIKYACGPTNAFLGAALGGDASIARDDLRDLANGVRGGPDADGVFPWNDYLNDPYLQHGPHDWKVIQQMVDNVAYLQSQGAAVPDVNWVSVCNMLDSHHTQIIKSQGL